EAASLVPGRFRADPRKVGGKLDPVSGTEFRERIRYVALDGLSREEELLGYVGVARSGGYELCDLSLAWTERGEAIVVFYAARGPSPGTDAERAQLLLGEFLQRLGPHLSRRRGGRSQLLGGRDAVGVDEYCTGVEERPQSVEPKLA